jgi:hypothetical protein
MKKREPTEMWLCVEAWLRAAYDKSWRHKGRELFNCGAGQMRRALDRDDLPEGELRDVERVIAIALRQRADDLARKASEAAALADDFVAKVRDRRSDVRAAEFRSTNDFVEACCREWLADNVEGYEKEAA